LNFVSEGVAVRQQQQRSPAPSTQHTPSPGSSKPASVYQGSFSSQLVDSQQKEFVFISWVVNPQEFWVQKDGCEGQLEALFTSAKEVNCSCFLYATWRIPVNSSH